MSEQMFNISSRFPVKLDLLLDFGDLDGSCICFLARYGFCFFCFLSASLKNMFSATIAAADLCPFYGENLPYSRRAMPIMPQQRQPRLLSPR
jgi:hypothetical protein